MNLIEFDYLGKYNTSIHQLTLHNFAIYIHIYLVK
jgi:hypothetical protein